MKDPLRVTTATRIWKDLCRWLRPSEWMIWLLGLKRTDAKPTDHGLILVQIDGLSRRQLERAIRSGRLPFLKSLIEREDFIPHDFYSGLPSSTPAVQAELHYGQRTAVPAFGFRDHRTGQLVRMFANDIAEDVESHLSQQTEGLLSGGSSYCNIYGGGAEEVHFCATSFGWSEFLRAINPFKFLVVILLNFWMFARVLGLMVIEFFLSMFDFVRGLLSGRQFWQELIMIPARVVVVVLLRELVTIGTCYDSARGLPVVHLNLLGYDEQAHRRGPESRFAHWTLKGIDNSIRRIWKAAHQGAGRDYDVWVFSDHGQETTRPYQLEHGVSLPRKVADLVEETVGNPCCDLAGDSVLDSESASQPIESSESSRGQLKPRKPKPDRLPSRANWLGINWLVSLLFGQQDQDMQQLSTQVQTVSSGPVGFVYLLTEQAREQRQQIAERLVQRADIPMVVLADQATRPSEREHCSDKSAEVITSQGRFRLPEDALADFGEDHPYLQDVTGDLMNMAGHRDSGEMMLVGWRRDRLSSCYGYQNGAHAGPGLEETHGFALLPSDCLLPTTQRDYLRPDDMRLAALRFLGRDADGHMSRRPAAGQGKAVRRKSVRIMTYNVHACMGMDGQLSPRRIARVIAQADADIVCLQELDVRRARSGNTDQGLEIAKHLEMEHQFHPAWQIQEERFGNAVFSRLPMRVVQAQGLHHHKADRSRRSALWVEVDIADGVSLQVINTHLSIYPREQITQANQLLEQWVHPASLIGPVVLCGDFNARPASATCRLIRTAMHDVESFDSSRTRSTLFSPFPISRVDHMFVTQDLKAMGTRVIGSRLAREASDHLPVLSDLQCLPKDVELGMRLKTLADDIPIA